ncbi:NAD(P)H-dependent glycerol-3-phosphate dehydrogenase [Aestuariivita sp.]|jgi:glycerol-3-phosphate dehydrogenase (NAD(P)+)|uniref:NAD(P)H-dependent glycerol-3-phosphate dehydrogenase n=1 Tax=Aestuariivita sp. TaxID=1872407 RepID=UPI002173FD22|nr:NAD(P)H-dependent glycerol-3-phosphate dehydrogenase [Aestuariivita sp.]MCE8005558.1 NAD(P)-dependent glycerol-3-phosphate dehydrogenase [Aestuariivita sp.]
MSVSVIGSGAFGTALAISLAGSGPVTLWSRSSDQVQTMRTMRENAQRLPGIALPPELTVTGDIRQAARAETLLLAVPMQQLRAVLQLHAHVLSGKALVACCKGVELGSHLGPIRIIGAEVDQAHAALLTGPSFARDIAQGLPTALTLACADADRGKTLQQALTTQNLRLYTTSDTIGAELGGALKNVIAIACGAVMGAGLGESARAALMTRGFAEMVRLAVTQGADARTLSGLSGFGDLALTCTSAQSRNYQMGFALGDGTSAQPNATVEGVATARSVAELGREQGLDLPITETVAALVTGTINVQSAIAGLMTRPLREE